MNGFTGATGEIGPNGYTGATGPQGFTGPIRSTRVVCKYWSENNAKVYRSVVEIH